MHVKCSLSFDRLAARVAGCGAASNPHDTSAAEHERAGRQHESAAESVEARCAALRRNELTAPIDREPSAIERLDRPGEPCWKAEDKRFHKEPIIVDTDGRPAMRTPIPSDESTTVSATR